MQTFIKAASASNFSNTLPLKPTNTSAYPESKLITRKVLTHALRKRKPPKKMALKPICSATIAEMVGGVSCR